MSSNEQAIYTANKQQFRQQTNINLDQQLQQSLEKAKHCRCSTAETAISTANKHQFRPAAAAISRESKALQVQVQHSRNSNFDSKQTSI
jgi:hypothetical protein